MEAQTCASSFPDHVEKCPIFTLSRVSCNITKLVLKTDFLFSQSPMRNCFKLSSEVQPVLYTSVQAAFSDAILDMLQFWKVQQAKVLDLKTPLDVNFSPRVWEFEESAC